MREYPGRQRRDAGDVPGRIPAALVFRRKRAPADDSGLPIKVGVAVVLIVVILAGGAHFREKQLLREHLLTVQAQEQARIVAARRAVLERQSVAQVEQAVQFQRQLYRCVDGNGTTSIQDAPCLATSSVTWEEQVSEETPLQASLRQEALNRQQAEARLREAEAGLAQATGAGTTSQTYYVTGANVSRCQSAKNQRDEAYRIAGNNRTFNMIRKWDDFVYEACKGT